MNLGERIRNIRKEKKITLVELSKMTGVAQASLSRIETGIMNGTVESHRKIAEALGLSLAELYTGLDPKLSEISYRNDKEIKKQAEVKSDNVRLELLTTQISTRKFAPILLSIPQNESITYEKLERGTEKFLWIQAGTVTVTLNNNDYTLNQNETLYFDASFSHIIKNTGIQEAKVLSVTSPSNF
ncbi:MAG: helix-turn-helix transcriptional regulator [Candidatus Omnitrophica bacterium]|nr:helix-turn-helix transcriptional regulator [Candidatus Omnitrophota bacterium]